MRTVTAPSGAVSETFFLPDPAFANKDGLVYRSRITYLDWVTTYSHDFLDNVIGVNQGGQTRTFEYDSLSRMKKEMIRPEEALDSSLSG